MQQFYALKVCVIDLLNVNAVTFFIFLFFVQAITTSTLASIRQTTKISRQSLTDIRTDIPKAQKMKRKMVSWRHKQFSL